ncbi:MAG: dUTP diphosphatase, partial [Acidobacteria bacterium]|nr:dUTP diphosphatase [Acidobacteriota bacterium]
YSGPADEVKIAVLNVTPRAVRLEAGDRIAQGIFLPAPHVVWEDVDRLRAESRGGFGATGT